jgi:phage-related holin
MKNIPTFDLEFAYPKLTIAFSTAWASWQIFFNEYVFSNWDFLPFIVILVVLDTFTGVWKSLKLSDFSSYSFGGFMTKVILYAVYLAVIHGLTSFSSKDSIRSLFSWVEQLGYAALIVREVVSIFENIGVIRPKLLPKFVLKRLRHFNEHGEFIQGQQPINPQPNSPQRNEDH